MTLQGALDSIPFITGYTFLACITILPLLAAIRPTRGIAGTSYVIASFVFGIALWVTACLITFSEYGLFAVIVGVLFIGVGVLPIALFGLLWQAAWGWIFSLLFLLALAWGCRFFGLWLIEQKNR